MQDLNFHPSNPPVGREAYFRGRMKMPFYYWKQLYRECPRRTDRKNPSAERIGFVVVIEAVEPVDNCEIVSSGAGNVVHSCLWMKK